MPEVNVYLEKDASVWQTYQDLNFGSPSNPLWAGYYAKNDRLNFLMKANLNSYVPSGSTINSASLNIYIQSISAVQLGPYRFTRINTTARPWEEEHVVPYYPGCTWINYVTTDYGVGTPWTIAGAMGSGDQYPSEYFDSGYVTAPGLWSIPCTAWIQHAWAPAHDPVQHVQGVIDLVCSTNRLTPAEGVAEYLTAYNRHDYADYYPYFLVDYTPPAGTPARVQAHFF